MSTPSGYAVVPRHLIAAVIDAGMPLALIGFYAILDGSADRRTHKVWRNKRQMERQGLLSPKTFDSYVEALVTLGYLVPLDEKKRGFQVFFMPFRSGNFPAPSLKVDTDCGNESRTTAGMIPASKKETVEERDNNSVSSVSEVSTEGEATEDHFQSETSEAEALLKEALGAEVIETQPTEFGQKITEAKAEALKRAGSAPMKFPPAFNPAAVGYTEEMFNEEFSLLNYSETLTQFMAYATDAGKPSSNWLMNFLAYATRGSQMARDRAAANAPEKEPAVNKAFAGDQHLREMYEKDHLEGEMFASWHQRMMKEGRL